MNLSCAYAGILDIMHTAGDQARAVQSNPQAHIKSDGTPVSAGDLIANDILVSWLQQHYTGDAILSEELEDDHQRMHNERLWIIDPIDGTSAYIDGRDDWAVQIALVVHRQLVMGALYLPGLQRSYLGVVGSGAWLIEADGRRQPIRVPKQPQPVLLRSRSERNTAAMDHAQLILSEFESFSVSSVGVKIDHMIRGLGSIYVNPSTIAEWDYAGPAAVLLAAGGHASDFDKQALPVNSHSAHCTGIIFSSHAEHDQLVDRLQDMRP